MKRLWLVTKFTLTALLAVLLAVQTPLSVLAAKKSYISEIVVESGSSAEEVKQKLTDGGYLVYDVNISSTASEDTNKNGGKCYSYQYIGYKVTDKAEEAITDIRVMNMQGGYSVAEYEELLKQKQEEIGVLIDSVSSAVEEYRANYQAEKDGALYAYRLLNMMVEDDSGLKMGDWLLDETKTRNDFITLFTQCNAAVFLTVAKALATACADSEADMVADLAKLDPADFEGETQYEETADAIFSGLTVLKAALSPYTNSEFNTDEEIAEDSISKVYEAGNDEEKREILYSYPLAVALKNLVMADGRSVLDLVLSDIDELTTEDFYPLASLLTPGQGAIVRYAGLQTVLSTSLIPADKWAQLDDYVEIDEDMQLSVYAGVDRSLFEGGVALTSKALVEAASSNDNTWFAGNLDPEVEKLFYAIVSISAGVCVGSICLWIGANMFKDYFCAAGHAFVRQTAYDLSRILQPVGYTFSEEAYQAHLAWLEQLQVYGGYAVQVFQYLTWIALGVALIVTAVYLVKEGYSYYHPDYTKIPKILVSKEYDANSDTVFVNYYSVKNLGGDAVDLCQYNGNRWLAAYTTKDKNAGGPILEGFEFSDTNYMENYVGVRKFSEDVAFDLARYSFDRKDTREDGKTVGDSYLFFTQAEEGDISASVFADSGNIILSVGALLLGGIVGGLAGYAIFRKRKKENITKA